MLVSSKELACGSLLLGRYEVGRCLGSGGMGSVYLAMDRQNRTLVALKEISPAVWAQPGIKERFKNEVTAQTGIAHQNVVRALDYISEGSIQALVVEFIDGGDLAARMGRGRLPIDEVLSILMQCAAGLKAIHASGVVHRDLKPENILLTREGQVKITDFGVAGLGRASTLTKTGTIVGTAKYVAPEFIEMGECDLRGDLYALGVIAFELISGVSPFKSGDLNGLIMERFKTTIREDLLVLAPECPRELVRIVTKMMSLSLAQRHQSAADLLVDLDQFAAQRSQPRTATPSSAIVNQSNERLNDPAGAVNYLNRMVISVAVGVAVILVAWAALTFMG